MSIATIFGTASCNDDQVFNQTDTAPLQVSVTAQGTQSSRAIIHGEYLPDGSSIGISLFTPDGADYDNQGYFNVKYTASGEGESQSWAAQGTTPSISANEAFLAAYYPYNPDVETVDDLIAFPIENQSQTDYMYSGLVEGISNANPKVNITMQHALTAICVNLVLGDYTGSAGVSGITVKSPGLASAATLNIASGELDGVSGQGDEFALTTEFDLIPVGTATDVLFVPDASVTEGSTTVSATIGGKKYTASISFDEAYLQGYIYTYTLTLNNSGFEVTKVSVNPWKDGTDKEAELEVYKDIEVDKTEHSTSKLGEQIKFTITAKNSWTASADQSWCTLNVTSGEPGVTTVLATVDENMLEQARFATITVTTENYSVPVVIYQKSELDDEYIVKVLINNDNMPYQHNINGFIGTVDWGDGTMDSYTVPVNLPEHTYPNADKEYTIVAKGSISALKYESYSFSKCLTEIVHIGDCGITSMNNAFAGSKNLKTIPEGLFDACTEVTDFSGAFSECTNLISIPNGLFDNNTKVTTFEYIFSKCANLQTIPEGLFNACTEVTNFQNAFQDCENLITIPEKLFDNNTKVWRFRGTFYNCTNLKSIPEGLFDKCTEVTDFRQTFAGCTGLTSIPEKIFEKNNKATDCSQIFYNCTNLQIIPNKLFDNLTEVTNFYGAFYGTGIIEIPEGLFDKCSKVINFQETFYKCANLSSIPVLLFDNNTKVTNFAGTFRECTSLTGESPYSVINIDGVDTKVHLYERKNYSKYFITPTGYSNCFDSCTGLTDYSSIPSNWK